MNTNNISLPEYLDKLNTGDVDPLPLTVVLTTTGTHQIYHEDAVVDETTPTFIEQIIDTRKNLIYTQLDIFLYNYEGEFTFDEVNTIDFNDPNNQIVKYIRQFVKTNNLNPNETDVMKLSPTRFGTLIYIISDINEVDYYDISKMKTVNSPEEFFSINDIIYLDVLDVTNYPLISLIEKFNNIIHLNDKSYAIILIKTQPEDLILKLKDILGNKFHLLNAINDNKIFIDDKTSDFFEYELLTNNQYIIDHYITNKTINKAVIPE